MFPWPHSKAIGSTYYFTMGVVYFHLHESLRIFFDTRKSDNKLIGAVNADLSVPQVVAGTKALGIIDKVVTGPLWRALAKRDTCAKHESTIFQATVLF
ncbi:hypothetical protein HOLleu_01680 [Holothuria leucospilota]|uniref:Uncharacterized protein n=1 Tax=Holothuria leucospilota TaxID=206669 RepID=A0A9Q1HL20_HOLLE|nr:hypothetical protein HOLleu_01680 [Holothuria leucospilota]